MKIKYKIYPERNLLVDVVEGHVSYPDLEKLMKTMVTDKNFKQVKRVLSDISNSHPDLTVEDTYKFIKLLVSPNQLDDFRWAIITSKPMQTALSFLVLEEKYFENKVGVFSTFAAAIKFLDVDYQYNELLDKDFIIVI